MFIDLINFSHVNMALYLWKNPKKTKPQKNNKKEEFFFDLDLL